MKRFAQYTAFPLMLSAMIATAYGQATPPATPRGAADRPETIRAAEPPATSASDPITQAIEMNNAEISLAKLASGKAQNAKVKSFADMMVKDHTAALAKLRTVQGVTTTDMKPSAKHEATADRLSKLSGAEFDREYMKTMVSDHQEALTFFEQQGKATESAAPKSGTTSLARVSQELTPTVREHLQKAQDISKDLETNSPRSNTDTKSNSNGTPAGTPTGNR